MTNFNKSILFKTIIRLIIVIQFFTFSYGQLKIVTDDCCHKKDIVENMVCCSSIENNHNSLDKSCCSKIDNKTNISDHNCDDYFNLINLKQNCGCDHQFVDLNTILLKIKTNKPSITVEFVHLLIDEINYIDENIRFNFVINSKPFQLISRDICILKSSFLI